MAGKKDNKNLTPMERQYYDLKANYSDCILLFRMGDFYEGFDEDAKVMSEVLGITLTSRSKGPDKRPMAGVPWHALDDYLYKLVREGYKVAIAEQLEDPQNSKGIVKRGVTRVVTPGTIDSIANLDAEKNNYLAFLVLDHLKNEAIGCLAYTDILQGRIQIEEFRSESMDSLLAKLGAQISTLNVTEIILFDMSGRFMDEVQVFTDKFNIRSEIKQFDDRKLAEVTSNLLRVLGVQTLKGYGINSLVSPQAVSAACLVDYINENTKEDVSHISSLQIVDKSDYMHLDISTVYNLNLINGGRFLDSNYSLYSVLNKCSTSMGKRMLYGNILRPSVNKNWVSKRLERVERLYEMRESNLVLMDLLRNISDLERIAGKIGLKRVTPVELIALSRSLKLVSKISGAIKHIVQFDEFVRVLDKEIYVSLYKKIESAIEPEAPRLTNQGGIFKNGFDKRIGHLRNIMKNSKQILLEIQQNEIQETGISSLKVKYNKVFGYFIEVSKSNLDRVPDNYIKKQTLVNSERFITPRLKEIEEEILNAENELISLEQKLYTAFVEELTSFVSDLHKLADVIAKIDVISSLAKVALEYNYVRPEITENKTTRIVDGRHPIVERFLEEKEFIPNDYKTEEGEDSVIILTGPNMSGKSTYIRQLALIQLMMQIGSFVPASEAKLPMTDKIFTRIGAVDDIAKGESTFMVEMMEVSNILNNATDKSLIILDEVGRGTSTYDGVAIAWSTVEYIHNNIGGRTLFATHYHELIRLESLLDCVHNYHVEVYEDDGEIIFLYKIKEGGISESYGIHVAKIAGLPKEVIERAEEILLGLEQEGMFEVRRVDDNPNIRKRLRSTKVPRNQGKLF